MKLSWIGRAVAIAAFFSSPPISQAKSLAQIGTHTVPIVPSPEPETISLMILGVVLLAGGAIVRNWDSILKR